MLRQKAVTARFLARLLFVTTLKSSLKAILTTTNQLL